MVSSTYFHVYFGICCWIFCSFMCIIRIVLNSKSVLYDHQFSSNFFVFLRLVTSVSFDLLYNYMAVFPLGHCRSQTCSTFISLSMEVKTPQPASLPVVCDCREDFLAHFAGKAFSTFEAFSKELQAFEDATGMQYMMKRTCLFSEGTLGREYLIYRYMHYACVRHVRPASKMGQRLVLSLFTYFTHWCLMNFMGKFLKGASGSLRRGRRKNRFDNQSQTLLVEHRIRVYLCLSSKIFSGNRCFFWFVSLRNRIDLTYCELSTLLCAIICASPVYIMF